MSALRRQRLFVEQLESRVVPAVIRNPNTVSFEITDNDANPKHTWTSPHTDTDYTVPENHILVGTVAVDYEFTKVELAAVRSNAGYNLDEELRWRERDLFPGDQTLATSSTYYKFTANSVTITYTPPNFSTTNGENTDPLGFEGNTAEYYGWLNDPGSGFNFKSGELWITNSNLGPAGGANRNPRTGTVGVGYDNLALFANPNLPALAGGATEYRVLAVNSTDGTSIDVTAANNTGYSLLAASSSALTWDANSDDLVIDPDTTFTPAYTNGTTVAGAWSGGETAWVVRDATGTKTFYLTGYTHVKMPAALIGLPDGQTASVSAGSVQAGNDALWLIFETDGESVSFLVTGRTANANPVANADSATTNQNTAITLSVLANDTDSNGDALTAVSATNGTNGTTTVNPNGTVTYTPSTGFTGTDSFTYAVSDGYGGSATGTVTVTVAPFGSISGVLWWDNDNDGIREAGEPLGGQGMSGVQIWLLDANDNVIEVQSDTRGEISFAGLAAGQYRVRVVLEPGTSVGLKDQGADDTIDSDFGSNGYSDWITVGFGEDVFNLDCAVI